MPININGVNSSATSGLRSKTEGTAQTKEPMAPNQAAPAESVAKERNDNVSLSSQVRGLKQLEGDIRKLPEVDQSRVAKIKAALSDGTYQIDNDKLASNLLNFEGDFS